MIAPEKNRFRKFRLIVGALTCTLALAAVPAQEETVYGDDYGSGNFGRVRDAESGVTLVRADWERAEGLEYDGVNSPVFPGDRLSTGDDQRVEIELAGGSLLRIDRRTELTFLALPDPYAEFADNTVLQLPEGRVRISASLRKDEEFRVDTPSATVYPLGDADLRIEVNGEGRTRVLSRRGVAEVVGAGGSVLVRGGMRTEVQAGSLPFEPEPYNTFASDGFDLWVERREASYERQLAGGGTEAYREIPEEVQPYYRELSSHGTWVDTSDYGWVWAPSGVSTDWRPYYNGYWGYGSQGYFWVSNEPWGWAPYHYGRWAWTGGYGWAWVPGRVFAGAWVSWSWGSAYVGWGPLDCWGYPAYRSVARYGYYDPYAWTFVSYNHFHYHNYYYHSVPVDYVGDDVHRSAAVTRPPRESPRNLAGSREARERAVRTVRDDVRAKIPPDGREARRSAPSFRKTEERIALRGGRDVSKRAVGGRAGTVPERATDRPSINESRFPRRLSNRPSATERKSTISRRPARDPGREGASRSDGSTGVSGKTRLPQVRQRENDAASGADRLRDMYRKMARPRQTRDPGKETAPSTGSRQDSRPKETPGGSGTRARPQGNPRKPTPQARLKSSTPQRRPTPKARPKSGSGSSRSTPKARSRSGSGSSRSTPKARPKSGSGSSRSTPKARPKSGSGSSRSTPKARPRSGSGSRGSTPKARPKSGSSSRSKGKSGASRRGSRR